ncbi:MAG: hypothetical protein R3320_14135, partial [Nitriliruptorales bacterium]|nr:hypothetical protein [Nitriliruptorales bacterium]
MTDLERRSVRLGVERELDEGSVVTMAAPTSPARTRAASRWNWARLGTVAAAMLGVFVIGGVVTTLDTGGDDAGG